MTQRLSNTERLGLAFAVMLTLSGCLGSGSSSTSSNPGGGTSNSPPTISGSPQGAVTTGDFYSFQPVASDADGDPLTFSILNQPAWANFDTSTGELTGQPTLGNIGTYSDIRISVSDQQASANLSPFSIEVSQTALGSATLSWSAPTQNTNGTNLNDLSGYKIYYGRNSGSYTNSIDINNPSITTYVVDNLVPGTYFFAATARNSIGVESGFSNEAQKSVN